MGEFASKGIAGTALGLGIGGTALGLLNNNNGCGGGLLSGLFGNNCGRNGNNCCEPLETKEAACLREQIAALKAEKYADAVGISAYRDAVTMSNNMDTKMQANMKEAFAAIAELDKREAVNQSEIKCLYNTLNTKIDGVHTEVLGEIKCLATNTNYRLNSLRDETTAAISLEAERRACGDSTLKQYVDGHFMPGVLKLPLRDICPRPAPLCPAEDTTPTA